MPWNRCTGFLDAMANWLIEKDKLPTTKNKQN
jgi:hypothetical protein